MQSQMQMQGGWWARGGLRVVRRQHGKQHNHASTCSGSLAVDALCAQQQLSSPAS